MIRLIIFDLDGPILDSFSTAKKSVFSAIEKMIKEGLIEKKKLPLPTEEKFILYWGYPGVITVKKFFPLFSKKEAELYINCWAEKETKKAIPLVRGARSALEKIKNSGYFTALLTARSHNLGFHLKNLNLEKYFDFFQSWDHPKLIKERVHPNHTFSSSAKTDADFFEGIIAWAKEKNVAPEQMLMIDDTLTGLRVTKKAGVSFLGVCTGPLDSKARWQRYGNLDGKYVINSIAELPKWLAKNMGV